MEEPPLEVHVQVDPAFEGQVAATSLLRAAETTLRGAQVQGRAELTVVITTDARVVELNKAYRGVAAATDVLAFGSTEATPQFVEAPGAGAYLGDVVISFPRAVEQATEFRQSVEAELSVLVVHGILHLLGCDHEIPEDRERMWLLQSDVLEKLGVVWQP